MESLITLTTLICPPSERLIELSGKLPATARSIDFLVSVEPLYTRLRM